MTDFDRPFTEIQERFEQGEVKEHGLQDPKMRALIAIACLSAQQAREELKVKTAEALSAGCTVTEIKETMYHAGAYCGYPRIKDALAIVNEYLVSAGIDPNEEDQGTVTANNRFEKGLDVQVSIFGQGIITSMEAAAPDVKHFRTFLSSNCFGDYYTRGTLDLKMRELITFTTIITIGGCEPQAKAHVRANLNVGNTKQTLIDALTTCVPYIGYPRTLNALACIEDVCK